MHKNVKNGELMKMTKYKYSFYIKIMTMIVKRNDYLLCVIFI